MNPAMVITEARKAGIVLELSSNGRMMFKGPRAAVQTWLPALQAAKPALLAHLRRAQRTEWDASDWKAHFDERAAIREYDGAMLRAEAEALASEDCLVTWLDHQHAATPAGVCAHCGHDGQHETVLPYGTERAGHAWLHGRCWPAWYDEKKQRAREALARMGIPAQGAATHGEV